MDSGFLKNLVKRAVPARSACAERPLHLSNSRNQRIDVIEVYEKERCPLILTERTRHLDILYELLCPKFDRLVLLKGGLGKKRLKGIRTELDEWRDEPHVVLATGRYLGEGVDDPRLDTLFLAMPVSWRGILSQYAGRLHRLHDDKSEVQIYDYVDQGSSVPARMFERRLIIAADFACAFVFASYIWHLYKFTV